MDLIVFTFALLGFWTNQIIQFIEWFTSGKGKKASVLFSNFGFVFLLLLLSVILSFVVGIFSQDWGKSDAATYLFQWRWGSAGEFECFRGFVLGLIILRLIAKDDASKALAKAFNSTTSGNKLNRLQLLRVWITNAKN